MFLWDWICREANMRLSEICEVYSGYAFTSFNDIKDGFPVVKIGNILADGTLNLEKCQYTMDIVNEKYYSKKGDIYIALSGATTGKIGIMSLNQKYVINQRVGIVRQKSVDIPQEYIKYFLLRQTDRILQEATGCAQPNISPKQIAEYIIPDISKEQMQEICEVLNRIKKIIDSRKGELVALDDLIKARFVEMFGDLKSNSKGWKIAEFKECAEIDTNMIHDFEGYEDYPHIGIDSIEKETGNLVGYRTIAEDDVISGKYLFTPKHIIYSKIRPKLNKVALPDFDGLCSADAYPILVKNGVCNREFFAYTMRSKYFLDYILAFSSRTNLPKVNKNQVEGFTLPLPPLELQNQFSDFVHQVDKSKVAVQKALDETQMLFDSLMQEYFG